MGARHTGINKAWMVPSRNVWAPGGDGSHVHNPLPGDQGTHSALGAQRRPQLALPGELEGELWCVEYSISSVNTYRMRGCLRRQTQGYTA